MRFDQPSTGNALTYEAIVRFESFPNDHEAFILRRRGHFQDHSFYAGRREDPASPGTYRRYMEFDLAEEGTYPGYTVISPIPVEMGVWYHVAGSYDGQVMRLYQDDIESYDPANPTLVAENAAVFNVGWGAYMGSWIGHGQDFYYGFDGAIDEFRISSVARTRFAEPPPAEKRTLLYYGLGDSVASGFGLEGDPDPYPWSGCHRAPGAYPNTVLTQLKEDAEVQAIYNNVTGQNLACSGIKSRELVDQIDTVLTIVRRAEPNTDVLVSITIGANDFPFSPSPLNKRFDNLMCSNDKQFEDQISRITDDIVKRLGKSGIPSLLDEGNAFIVFTDYHNPFNKESTRFRGLMDSQPACWKLLSGLSEKEQFDKLYQRTEQAIVSLKNTLLVFAAGTGSDHVGMASVHGTFQEDGGHESARPGCGTAPPDVEQTWVQHKELQLGIIDCYHPNLTGAGKFADAVKGVATQLLSLD